MSVFEREAPWRISKAEALQLARAMLEADKAIDDVIEGWQAGPLKTFSAPPQSFLN